jgi:GNAT superfamily N-acetyltransferase
VPAPRTWTAAPFATYSSLVDCHSLGPDGRFSTRRLEPPDLPALQSLFERGSEYFVIATGAPPGPDEAERAFVGGPPSKAVSDKQTIGVFDGTDALVGVLDAIPDFPSDGTCTIGLLLLQPAARGHGLGPAVLAAFEAWMARRGTRQLRTAVVARHAEGIRFLQRHGWAPLPAPEGPAARAGATVVFFEKEVPPPP